MPEGDTVWLAGRRLHEALAGRQLRGSDFRVPRLATVDLAGTTVAEVRSRGKHLLLRLAGGPGDGHTLHTHFRMDGSWHLYRPGERWRGGPGHQVRAVLRATDVVAVGYRLPVLELLPTDREHEAVGHLGPDVLGDDWDPAEAARRLAADPARPIGDALLDQRVLAGLGTVYRTETCFLAGVTPYLPVGELGTVGPVTGELVDLAHRLLDANKERHLQVTTGDTRRGRWHWVYGQRACLRCGGPVATGELGRRGRERLTWWCPSCQRGPSPASIPLRELLPPTVGRTRYRP